MKKILVAVDFSAASDNAAEYAASLAQEYNAGLLLVHIWIPPVAIGEVPAVIMTAEADLQLEKEEEMKRLVERLGKKFNVPVDSFVDSGDAAAAIKDIAEKKHADMIVMGMKGKGKSSGLFGSTVTSVTRHAQLPVLVIPENVPYKSIYTVTLAADFDISTPIGTYQLLKQLAEKHNAYINVLHVSANELVLTAEESAGKMKAEIALTKLRHGFFTVEGTSVEEGISHFTETHPSEMLAMVAHHHSFFERLFGKVHTKAMSHQAKLPLLFLKEQQQ